MRSRCACVVGGRRCLSSDFPWIFAAQRAEARPPSPSQSNASHPSACGTPNALCTAWHSALQSASQSSSAKSARDPDARREHREADGSARQAQGDWQWPQGPKDTGCGVREGPAQGARRGHRATIGERPNRRSSFAVQAISSPRACPVPWAPPAPKPWRRASAHPCVGRQVLLSHRPDQRLEPLDLLWGRARGAQVANRRVREASVASSGPTAPVQLPQTARASVHPPQAHQLRPLDFGGGGHGCHCRPPAVAGAGRSSLQEPRPCGPPGAAPIAGSRRKPARAWTLEAPGATVLPWEERASAPPGTLSDPPGLPAPVARRGL